jgi:hypothetical protein
MTGAPRVSRIRSFLAQLGGKIAGHYYWGLFIAILVSLVSSTLTFINVYRLESNVQSMYEEDFMGQNLVQAAQVKLYLIDAEVKNALLSGERFGPSGTIIRMHTYQKDLDNLLRKAKPLFSRSAAREQFEMADQANAEWAAIIRKVIDFSKAGNPAELTAIVFGEMKASFEKLDGLLDGLDDIQQRSDLQLYEEIRLNLKVSLFITLAALAGSIGVRIYTYSRKKRLQAQACTDDGRE